MTDNTDNIDNTENTTQTATKTLITPATPPVLIVKRKLKNGTEVTYKYDRNKYDYFQPREKKPPKYKRLPNTVKQTIFRLHKLNVGFARISRFINSDLDSNLHIGERAVERLIKDPEEIRLFKDAVEKSTRNTRLKRIARTEKSESTQ